MKLSEYNDRIREHLATVGWVNRARGPNGECCVVVASGAIEVRFNPETKETVTTNQMNYIIDFWNALLPAPHRVVEWNDSPERTWEEVQAFLRHASQVLRSVGL